MFFDRLYLQYNDGTRKSFASYFMDAVGRWLLGSLEQNGIEVMPELSKSFYYIKEDRIPPSDPKKLEQWKRQSILLAQFRAIVAPKISLAVAICSMTLVLGLVAIGGSIHLSKTGLNKASSFIGGIGASGQDKSECEKMLANIQSGAVPMAAVNRDKLNACVDLLEGGEK